MQTSIQPALGLLHVHSTGRCRQAPARSHKRRLERLPVRTHPFVLLLLNALHSILRRCMARRGLMMHRKS